MFVDYYAVLGISLGCSQAKIKKAFREQALKWHPDVNKHADTTDRMRLINEAYLILSDLEARIKYDAEYLRFKNYSESSEKESAKEGSNSKEKSKNKYHYSDFSYSDEEFSRWVQNAKRQAVELAKRTYDEFLNIGGKSLKAGGQEAVKQISIHVLISLIALLLIAVIGC